MKYKQLKKALFNTPMTQKQMEQLYQMLVLGMACAQLRKNPESKK